MAIVIGEHSVAHGGGMSTVTWAGLANGDTGSAAQLCSHPDKTLQVFGTFGTGGSVSLEGSNDGTNWVTLTDVLGNAVTLTAAGMMLAAENPVYIRPNVTAGDGTTALTVIVAALDAS